MAIQQRRLTLEEFLELPEEEPALEFEDGMVTQKVPPQGKHARLQLSIGKIFDRFSEPNKVALAFTELRTTYAGLSRVPDVAVYQWERIPRDSDGKIANDFRAPPDIAVEIVSPGQSVNQLVQRCLWFVSHGVKVALLVDPSPESVLVFRPDRVPIVLAGADNLDLGDALPGFTIAVQDIFDVLSL